MYYDSIYIINFKTKQNSLIVIKIPIVITLGEVIIGWLLAEAPAHLCELIDS